MSEKIRPHHLERKAILYVRQSSAHQVLHNRESSALQYAMRDRLAAQWPIVDCGQKGGRTHGVGTYPGLHHGNGRPGVC